MFRLALLCACLGSATTSSAAILWTDAFSRSADPLTYDFTGNGANDYTVAGTSGVIPALGSENLVITDSVSTQFAQNVLADQFAPFSLSAGDAVTISLDVNVSGFLAANAASTFRLSILDGNAANGTGVLTVGWGYSNVATGDATSELHFYSTLAAGVTPTPTHAIGWSGGSPAAGFDFGDYNSASAASNDTAPHGTAPSVSYRIAVTMTQGSHAASGSITNLPTSESTAFSNTLTNPFDWGQNASDGIQLLSGLGGTGVFTVDNIEISTIPEPSAAALGLLALVGLLSRRSTSSTGRFRSHAATESNRQLH